MNTLTPPVSEQDHIIGSLEAPIVLVEYGDFDCPDCGMAYPHIKNWIAELGDSVCFVFRNMPLDKMYDIHPFATQAALAAEAAALQGKFWEMHAQLFENQHEFDEASLLSYAETVGIDGEQLLDDMKSDAVIAAVTADFESGKASGVKEAPIFFINGVFVEEPRNYEAIKAQLISMV